MADVDVVEVGHDSMSKAPVSAADKLNEYAVYVGSIKDPQGRLKRERVGRKCQTRVQPTSPMRLRARWQNDDGLGSDEEQ